MNQDPVHPTQVEWMEIGFAPIDLALSLNEVLTHEGNEEESSLSP